jgi:hypothetical protein
MANRRSFLKMGLVGGGALALGSLTLATRSTRLRTPATPLRLLTVQEFSILAAVAERVCPGRESFPAPEAMHVAERVDALLANAHPGLSGEIRQLVHLFENGLANFIFDRRPRAFSQMDAAEQDATLNDWRHSSITLRRTGYKALTGLITAAYYSNPATYAAVGYPGPPDIGAQPASASVAPADRLGDPS